VLNQKAYILFYTRRSHRVESLVAQNEPEPLSPKALTPRSSSRVIHAEPAIKLPGAMVQDSRNRARPLHLPSPSSPSSKASRPIIGPQLPSPSAPLRSSSPVNNTASVFNLLRSAASRHAGVSSLTAASIPVRTKANPEPFTEKDLASSSSEPPELDELMDVAHRDGAEDPRFSTSSHRPSAHEESPAENGMSNGLQGHKVSRKRKSGPDFDLEKSKRSRVAEWLGVENQGRGGQQPSAPQSLPMSEDFLHEFKHPAAADVLRVCARTKEGLWQHLVEKAWRELSENPRWRQFSEQRSQAILRDKQPESEAELLRILRSEQTHLLKESGKVLDQYPRTFLFDTARVMLCDGA